MIDKQNRFLLNKRTDIIVECYSGYKADERPMNFIAGDKKLMVDRIIEQWRSPDAEYFKVQADDGKGYLLVHDNIKDNWILEKVYKQGKTFDRVE